MSTSKIRLVRSAPDPLGLYIRAGRIDRDLQSFITAGSATFTGVVFEAKRVERQKELLTLVLEKGLDAILDPQTQAMATVGGYVTGMDCLSWSNKRSKKSKIFQHRLSSGRWPTKLLSSQSVSDLRRSCRQRT